MEYFKMLTGGENKSMGKSAGRNRKAEQRSRKPAQQAAKPDQVQDPEPQISAAVTSTEIVPADNAPADSSPTQSAPTESSPAEIPPAAPVASKEAVPVSLQTIADAYGDYFKKSFEQTRSYFEKLASVRSLDKAFELQTEFAKQACENFSAESKRIGDLYGELTKQRSRRFEDFVARMNQATLSPMR
jgi:Tfp pilus assembly protein FimV